MGEASAAEVVVAIDIFKAMGIFNVADAEALPGRIQLVLDRDDGRI